MRGTRGGGGGPRDEPGEPSAGEKIAIDRSRSADQGGQGALVARPSGEMCHAFTDDHGVAHVLHRSAKGDRQRGLPANRRHAVGPCSDSSRLLGRRRGRAGDRSSAVARSHPGRQAAAPRHRSAHLRPAQM